MNLTNAHECGNVRLKGICGWPCLNFIRQKGSGMTREQRRNFAEEIFNFALKKIEEVNTNQSALNYKKEYAKYYKLKEKAYNEYVAASNR